MAENKQIRYIPIAHLYAHPDNPRKDLGDVSELAENIKANGVLQNLTVVPVDQVESVLKERLDKIFHAHSTDEIPNDKAYVVIIGHRRLAAAKLAGLEELPCVVANMTPEEQLAVMLTENIQREKLTVYEEAMGFQQLHINFGKSVQEIADAYGFHPTTVRRRLKMAELDPDTLREISGRQIALADFDRLAKIEDIEIRNKVLQNIGTRNFDQSMTEELNRQAIRKNLPLVKKLLKESGLKKLAENERYNSKYTQVSNLRVVDWEEGTPLFPAEEKPEFYILDHYNNYAHVYFYRKAERAKAPGKPPEQTQEQKRIRQAWDMLKEKSALAYQLRSTFIAGVSVSGKNMAKVYEGAVTALLLCECCYNSPNHKTLFKLLKLPENGVIEDRTHKVMEAYNADPVAPPAFLPQLVYAAFGDSKDKRYAAFSSPANFPQYYANAELDALYDWLISLGYEMSDEEKALRDGTHAVFHMAEEKAVQNRKMYVNADGDKYKVMGGIGGETFKARRQKADKSGEECWKGVAQLPWRDTFAEAQDDLDQLAAKHGWQEWDGEQ